jgi:hypothetical protein
MRSTARRKIALRASVTSFDADYAVAQLASVSSSAVGITDAPEHFSQIALGVSDRSAQGYTDRKRDSVSVMNHLLQSTQSNWNGRQHGQSRCASSPNVRRVNFG